VVHGGLKTGMGAPYAYSPEGVVSREVPNQLPEAKLSRGAASAAQKSSTQAWPATKKRMFCKKNKILT